MTALTQCLEQLPLVHLTNPCDRKPTVGPKCQHPGLLITERTWVLEARDHDRCVSSEETTWHLQCPACGLDWKGSYPPKDLWTAICCEKGWGL